ncbi:DeoR/GlpR transcriptional regulator [Spiractinospora alimapuensis]|uniref:DeoR/GlpR family DNA-binding transcription regulator n=1 Tax=Spiractinospora alimapuensis TaxID=2820884 RepID=UPI001F160D3A|nr:DeoR/GlpR family DNA-binding transcription regulator [Spiractinospora alimapuensis]QVQ51262.1 DeoR/GlpR transcriptional regulator [Spiractinospora alimapuensis]
MIPDQRRERLVKELRSAGVLSVRELCDVLSVSHMTVRRDISVLERDGRVYSVPGGVKLARQIETEPSYLDKSVTDVAEKQAMAKAAAALVQSGQMIYLDAGTTIGHMVPHIWDIRDLTVVTNDLTTAARLIDHPSIDLFHIGGRVDRKNRSVVGDIAARTMGEFNLDLAFVSTSSWDLKRGSTTPSEPKVVLKRAAMRAAVTSVLVAGAAKYGSFGTLKVASLDQFDHIITDAGFSPHTAGEIRASGVYVELAEPGE